MKLCFLSSLLLFIFSAQGVPHKCIQKSPHTSDTDPTDTATCVICPQVVPEEPTCEEGSIAQFQSQTCDECAKYTCVPSNETNPGDEDEIIPLPEEDCPICAQAQPEEPTCASGFTSTYRDEFCGCGGYVCAPDTNPSDKECVTCTDVSLINVYCESGVKPQIYWQNCTHCATYTCEQSR